MAEQHWSRGFPLWPVIVTFWLPAAVLAWVGAICWSYSMLKAAGLIGSA